MVLWKIPKPVLDIHQEAFRLPLSGDYHDARQIGAVQGVRYS